MHHVLLYRSKCSYYIVLINKICLNWNIKIIMKILLSGIYDLEMVYRYHYNNSVNIDYGDWPLVVLCVFVYDQ